MRGTIEAISWGNQVSGIGHSYPPQATAVEAGAYFDDDLPNRLRNHERSGCRQSANDDGLPSTAEWSSGGKHSLNIAEYQQRKQGHDNGPD